MILLSKVLRHLGGDRTLERDPFCLNKVLRYFVAATQ